MEDIKERLYCNEKKIKIVLIKYKWWWNQESGVNFDYDDKSISNSLNYFFLETCSIYKLSGFFHLDKNQIIIDNK